MPGAKRPDVVRPILDPGAAPDAHEAWIAGAADALRSNGVVVLPNAIPRPQLSRVADALKGRQAGRDDGDGRAFQPAPLRPAMLVPLEGAFADPAIFAPPQALAVARKLLGQEMIIGEIGAMILPPGAGPHEARRAAIRLFGGLDVEGDVPPAALTMLAPAADVGPGMGLPEYWLGSHRTRKDAAGAPFQPALEAGSVVMSDWRTLYRGGVNTTGAPLPAFYVSFQRKWLVSLAGSEYRPGLSIPPASFKTLPETYRPLTAWAMHRNKTDDVSEFMHLWMGRALKGLRTLRGS